MICIHAGHLKNHIGIQPNGLSACSLYASGVMAHLSGGCKIDIIKLLGQLKSHVMMDYLHQNSLPIFCKLVVLIFNNGQHTFLPSESVTIWDQFSFPHFIPILISLANGLGLVQRSKTNQCWEESSFGNLSCLWQLEK